MGELGFDVTHLYGLTEAFGPAMICDWRPEWNDLDAAGRARMKARQGVGNMIAVSARVVDAGGADVPADGESVGEIALRGNNVMLGYLKDPDATNKAAPDGWFRTGDLGVQHPDGYVELRDRSKDVIISGGENIASVEVEQAIAEHPAVLEAAQDVHREDPEVRAAGAGLGRAGAADLTGAGQTRRVRPAAVRRSASCGGAAPSRGAPSGRCSRWGSSAGSPGAPARPPRTARPAAPR
jgi:acyl-CoA synthetase (AMP-forming)/AMP-acid ligase II